MLELYLIIWNTIEVSNNLEMALSKMKILLKKGNFGI